MLFKYINKIVGYGILRLRCFFFVWVDVVFRYLGFKVIDGALWFYCLGVIVYFFFVEGYLSFVRFVVSIYFSMGFYLFVYLYLISLFIY